MKGRLPNMKISKRTVIAVYSVLVLAIPLFAQDANFDMSDADKLMATAAQKRKEGGPKAEIEYLRSTCESHAKSADSVYDDVFYKYSGYNLAVESKRKAFLSLLSDEQSIRLLDKAKSQRDLHKQILFAQHLLDNSKGLSSQARAGITHDLAVVYYLTEFTPEKSIALWTNMSKDYKGTADGDTGSVFCEAITGPKTIASLEALHELSILQHEQAGNINGAMMSNQRVISACKKPFFRDYIKSADVPKSDKIEMLGIELYATYMGGELTEVKSVADQIFSLSEYKGKIAEEAAIAVGLCNQKLGYYQEAIKNYENFVRAFPSSSKVPQALLNMAMTEHLRGNFIEAAAQYAVLVEMYPKSKAAHEAKSRLIVLKELENNQDNWNLDAKIVTERDTIQTYLHPKTPNDLAQLWPCSPVYSVSEASSQTTKTLAASLVDNTKQQHRLAQAIPDKYRIR